MPLFRIRFKRSEHSKKPAIHNVRGLNAFDALSRIKKLSPKTKEFELISIKGFHEKH